MFSGKTIFIAALDWGLGHATRCVPLIRALEKNNKIIIGVTPVTKYLFDEEFAACEKVSVPAYGIRYSSVLPLWLKLLFDSPRILSIISEENKFLDALISEKNIDVVISDSRFGLHSKKIHSVFITHQLFLKTPFLTGLFQDKNRSYLSNFDEIWVPDYADEKISLAGKLSHGKHFHKNVKYIGPQSRLEKINTEKKYDYLFIVSGPEPQQSIFLKECVSLVKKNPVLKYAVVAPVGQNGSDTSIDFFINPSPRVLSELICGSKKIICRSGYSTLMDLHLLGFKELTLVPTTGQTEQEYLADLWKEKFGAIVAGQKNLDSISLSQS